MFDVLVWLFLILVLIAIIQYILLLKKNSDIARAEAQAKIQELLNHLDEGANDLVDEQERNILMIAASEKFCANRGELSYRDVMDKAIEHGIDINAVNVRNGWTALNYAVAADYNLEDVKFLLSKGADPNHEDSKGNNALFQAVQCENTNMSAIIIDKIHDLDLQNERGDTALMVAATHMNVFSIHGLLDKGANPALRNEKGQTAYDIAMINKKNHYKHSGDSAQPDTYGKRNHEIDEAARRIQCSINGKKFKKRRYKAPRSVDSDNME